MSASGFRTGPVTGTRSISLKARLFLMVLISAFLMPTAALTPAPVAAFNVCSDPDAPCIHEYMADQARALFTDGDIALYWNDIKAGTTHEDQVDHVYSYSSIAGALITITHFWDSDRGPTDGVENVLGTFENAWQKMQSLWSLALGAYAKGQKGLAYHYFGHVVHLMGDATIPTHVHDDMHGPDFYDDDAYEEWMSVPAAGGGPSNALLTNDEKVYVKTLGLINIPAVSDKLEWLLYTTNQIADFFPSDDVEGDSTDARGFVQAELTKMDGDITTPRTSEDLEDNDGTLGFDNNNNDDGDLSVIRFWSYLRGIRSIAALYKLFEETVQNQVTLAVVIDRVEEDADHDYLCGPNPLFPPIPPPTVCVETSDPDFYARVAIDGREARNRGDRIDGQEQITPGWAFGNTVGTSGSVPVHVEIWDDDGAYTDTVSFAGADDQSDIDAEGGGSDRTLDLTVDLAKCVNRQSGAITGEVSGDCGQQFIQTGDADNEASQIRFRVIVSKSPPVADAGGPYTTLEGTTIELTGTGSSDPDNDITTYAWDLDGDGVCDDVANDATPDFTAVGQDGVTTVKLCLTDAVGLTDEDTATVTVNNVAPSLRVSSDAPKSENTSVTVSGTFTDPGWLDSLSGTIDWGDGSGVTALSGTLENVSPDATLTFSTSHTYGDNGTWTVQVCAADDDTAPCTSFSVTITNTAPTAAIDLSGAVSVNGTPTIIAHAGQAVGFRGRSTDPGSDDLTLAWAWGDGTPGSATTSLVNPPNPDPLLSPSIQPRDITSQQSHTFAGACVYATTFTATDDDAGSATSTANVIIVGNNHPNQPHGYWKQQFRYFLTGKGSSAFDAAKLQCYLRIVGYMSRVFDERTAASTFAQADDVLDTSATSAIFELFDQQLLAAWLNFANGAIEFDRMVDTNGDRVADTRFLAAIRAAETLRLDPASTRTQLDRQKVIVERWTSLP